MPGLQWQDKRSSQGLIRWYWAVIISSLDNLEILLILKLRFKGKIHTHTKGVIIMTALTRNTRSTIAAVGFAVLGLFFAVSSVSIVASMLGAGVGGEAVIAAKIVDAIIAGSTVATIVGLLAGGGLSGVVIGGIKWAIKKYGREKAIS